MQMNKPMRIMCIDYGTKRMGVAVSDPSCTMSHPLETILVRENGAHMESLKGIIRDYQVEKIVVGLPYDMDGKEGESARRVIEWARDLEQVLELPIELWDERLSTSEAHEILMHLKVKGPKKRQLVDKIAASIILQSYLDARRS